MRINKNKLKSFQDKVDYWLSFNLTCSGNHSYTEDWEFSDSGYDAITCLYLWESRGVKYPCNEIIELERYLQAKGSLDLQIKMWSEDRAKGWLGLNDFKQMAKEMNLQEWVFIAVENQKIKMFDTINMCL